MHPDVRFSLTVSQYLSSVCMWNQNHPSLGGLFLVSCLLSRTEVVTSGLDEGSDSSLCTPLSTGLAQWTLNTEQARGKEKHYSDIQTSMLFVICCLNKTNNCLTSWNKLLFWTNFSIKIMRLMLQQQKGWCFLGLVDHCRCQFVQLEVKLPAIDSIKFNQNTLVRMEVKRCGMWHTGPHYTILVEVTPYTHTHLIFLAPILLHAKHPSTQWLCCTVCPH